MPKKGRQGHRRHVYDATPGERFEPTRLGSDRPSSCRAVTMHAAEKKKEGRTSSPPHDQPAQRRLRRSSFCWRLRSRATAFRRALWRCSLGET